MLGIDENERPDGSWKNYPCKCGGEHFDVVDSRTHVDNNIHRRRQCIKCGSRISTVERPKSGGASRPLVILESPYAGDVEANTRYARKCVKDSLLRGEAPIASHLLYTQTGILNDDIPEERQMGIEAGLEWRAVAEKSVVYLDRGMTKGMEYGVKAAEQSGLEVEYRYLLNEEGL